jgi:glycosyltransferase involved in cell wall biosynthesis
VSAASTPEGRPLVLLAGDFPEHPPMVIGGIQAVTWQLASGVAAVGDFRVHTLACERFWRDSTRRRWRSQWGDCTAHYLRSPARIPHVVSSWTSDAEYVRWQTRATGAHLIHAHGQVGYTIGAIRSGLPHVVTPHGMLRQEKRAPRGASQISADRLRQEVWSRTEDWCLAHAQHLVAISPYVRRLIAPRVRGQVHEIPNPVDPDFFALAGAQRSEPVMLTVGWLNARKRQELIIRALPLVRERVPGASLRIVGNPEAGDVRELQRLRALVGELGLGGAVTFLQGVSHEGLLEEYSAAALYVHAAEEESSPMAVAQAMAAGLPLCAVDIPGLHHLLQDGHTGRYAADPAPESIALAVSTLLTDTTVANAMGARAHREARERFHPSVVASATSDLYHRVLAGSAARPR